MVSNSPKTSSGPSTGRTVKDRTAAKSSRSHDGSATPSEVIWVLLPVRDSSSPPNAADASGSCVYDSMGFHRFISFFVLLAHSPHWIWVAPPRNNSNQPLGDTSMIYNKYSIFFVGPYESLYFWLLLGENVLQWFVGYFAGQIVGRHSVQAINIECWSFDRFHSSADFNGLGSIMIIGHMVSLNSCACEAGTIGWEWSA